MTPGKRSLSLQYGIKNTKKKGEIYPGGNYSEKNVWGEFHGVKISERGRLIDQRRTIEG